MNNQAKIVAHPETGLLITPSVNKPEFGSIRIDSQQKVFSNGFMSVQKRTAFVSGRIEDLETMNLRAGMVLPGKIIRIESFSPFYTAGVNGATRTQESKINPTTGEIVLTDGRPTYLNFVYTEDKNAQDYWISEESEDAVVNAVAEQELPG